MSRHTDDAFGRSLWDHQTRGQSWHVVERDDRRLEVFDSGVYFAPATRWRVHERAALKLARGRVLDIGCGAGRHALHLQQRGLDVLGVDESPFAIKTCRARGLKRAKVVDIDHLTSLKERFDTVLLLGNNFGLLANPTKARRILKTLHRLTTDDARIITDSNDIYQTPLPEHLAYQRRNRQRGRMSGQIRIRVRYESLIGRYFDYLMVSPAEMKRIITGTGWTIARTIPSKGSGYVAVMEKAAR